MNNPTPLETVKQMRSQALEEKKAAARHREYKRWETIVSTLDIVITTITSTSDTAEALKFLRDYETQAQKARASYLETMQDIHLMVLHATAETYTHATAAIETIHNLEIKGTKEQP